MTDTSPLPQPLRHLRGARVALQRCPILRTDDEQSTRSILFSSVRGLDIGVKYREHEAGGPLTEEVINIPLGGHRSQRRPDINFRNWITGEYYRENVGRIYSNGQPIRREVEALDDLERATGQRPGYTPYD